MADVLTERHEVRARKKTWCDWCGKRIGVGETHTASSLVGDGRIYTFRECKRCEPYVTEMYDTYYQLHRLGHWYDVELNSHDFDAFMSDEHPEVLRDWERGIE